MNQNISNLLSQIKQPALLVQDQHILEVNPAAKGLLLEVGQPILPLLSRGKKEYETFSEGRLSVTLTLAGRELEAIVIRSLEQELLVLSETDQVPELLRVLSLSGQDLRKPLTEVFALAEQLLPKAENQEQARLLYQNLFRLQRIICNMTDAGRSLQSDDEGRELCNITTLFWELLEKVTQSLGEAGPELQYVGLPRPVFSNVDEEKLERGIFNILSNAIKFSDGHGPIRAVLRQKDNWAYFTVTNPVAPNLQISSANPFDRYLREPGIEDARFGIGLGMVMIQAAAMAHGGTVLIQYPTESEMKLTMSLKLNSRMAPTVRDTPLKVDYAGEQDHCLLELSDALPADCYTLPQDGL